MNKIINYMFRLAVILALFSISWLPISLFFGLSMDASSISMISAFLLACFGVLLYIFEELRKEKW